MVLFNLFHVIILCLPFLSFPFLFSSLFSLPPATHRLFSEPELPAAGLILLCYCLQWTAPSLSLFLSLTVSLCLFFPSRWLPVIWLSPHTQRLHHVFIGLLWFSHQFHCLLCDETINGLFRIHNWTIKMRRGERCVRIKMRIIVNSLYELIVNDSCESPGLSCSVKDD